MAIKGLVGLGQSVVGLGSLANPDITYLRQSPAGRADAQAGTDDGRPAIGADEANVIVRRVAAGFKNGLAAGIRFSVVDNFYDLPPFIVSAAIQDKAENAIDGANFENTIYLVRDKHATAEEFEKHCFTNCMGMKDSGACLAMRWWPS
jgi:hypothetical protein